MFRIKGLFFILLCFILGCATSSSLQHSKYFSSDSVGKKTLFKEVTLCKVKPGYTKDFSKKFPGQVVYYMEQLSASGCLDTPVTIPSGTDIQVNDYVHVSELFSAGSTYAFGYVFHPIEKQNVPFYSYLYSPGYDGACNNPNAPFNLTTADCQKYFDHLDKPWR